MGIASTQAREGSGGQRPVGYFYHLRRDDRHSGAILVTDRIGVPLEFKYTEPVTATRLHKILYGRTLERYIHETLIRDRLARELQTDPQYFITPYEDKEFLSRIAGREAVAVQRLRPAPGENGRPFTRVRDCEGIVELEEGATVRLAFSTADEALQMAMVAWLQEIGRTMDVLEPLERMANALTALCGDGKKGLGNG